MAFAVGEHISSQHGTYGTYRASIRAGSFALMLFFVVAQAALAAHGHAAEESACEPGSPKLVDACSICDFEAAQSTELKPTPARPVVRPSATFLVVRLPEARDADGARPGNPAAPRAPPAVS